MKSEKRGEVGNMPVDIIKAGLTSRLTAALHPRWRLLPGGPRDLGPQQGAPASSTAELRVEVYFLSVPVERKLAHLLHVQTFQKNRLRSIHSR